MKKKYYIIGILAIVVLGIVLYLLFNNRSQKIKVYDKYSARISINYDGNSYSRNFDYDGDVGRVTYDGGTVYMDKAGLYYTDDGSYNKYLKENNYVLIGSLIEKFKLWNRSGEEYSCESSEEFLKSLFIKAKPNGCYLTLNDGYVQSLNVDFDKGNVTISFKKLNSDYKVSMLGYYDEKAKEVHDNILEIK